MVPTLKLGRSIKEILWCTCCREPRHNDPGKGEMLVLDMNSSVKHRLELSDMLEDHINVTCHNNQGKGEGGSASSRYEQS